jgi:predicted RNA-binding protein with PUA-like domain
MRWWLFKTEHSTYSWDDLVRDRKTCWEGVRNYQARNLLRDEVTRGDLVFVYHSVVQPQVIAGVARVVRETYPDHYAQDPSSPYFDPKANPDDPRWLMVDVEPVRALDPPITRDELKEVSDLADMMLLRRGSRLSVQPVSDRHAKTILGLRGLSIDSVG